MTLLAMIIQNDEYFCDNSFSLWNGIFSVRKVSLFIRGLMTILDLFLPINGCIKTSLKSIYGSLRMTVLLADVYILWQKYLANFCWL